MTKNKNKDLSKSDKKELGRKEKYKEMVKPRLEEITYWCRLGEIEENICKFLGVGVSTFNRYKNDYKELREALNNGKMVSIARVAASLYKRANGYEYKEKTREYMADPETGTLEFKITKVVTKEVIPDVKAQIFYLKNRDSDNWKDKNETELSGDFDQVNINVVMAKTPDETD